ncbi:MAG: DUF3604 domain-containing protein [Verrucomicrobiales bacterium]
MPPTAVKIEAGRLQDRQCRLASRPGCGDAGIVVPVVFARASLDHRLLAVSPPGNRLFSHLVIPTPRWYTYDPIRSGLSIPEGVPVTIQKRAWSSLIWHAPCTERPEKPSALPPKPPQPISNQLLISLLFFLTFR